MSRESIRSKLDLPATDQRFLKGEYTAPDDVSDPHTLEDETRTSWRGWMAENKELTALFTILGFVGIVLLTMWGAQLAPGILTNKYLHYGLVGIVATTAIYLGGVRSALGRLTRFDWLVLVRKRNPTIFLGYHFPSDEADHDIFVPVKGFSLFGHRDHVLTVAEVSSEAARSYENMGRSGDDPATIALHNKFAGVAHTAFGTIVTQPSTGIALNNPRGEALLKAELPDMAEEGQIQDFKDEIQNTLDELRTNRSKVSSWKRRAQNAETEARERREEIIEEFISNHKEIVPDSYYGKSGDDDGGGGISPRPNGDYQQIEADLAADD